MELKSGDSVEEKKLSGLKLVTENEEEIKKKTDISDIETWDFSMGEDPYYVTQGKSKLQKEAKENRGVKPSDIIVKISKILMYVAVVVEIIFLAMVCMGNGNTILYRLTDYKYILYTVALVLFVDALLVNILFEFHLMLVLVAVVLPFFYPFLRSSIVDNKKGIGQITSLLYFLSICFTLGCLWTAHVNYGNLLTMEDRQLQEKLVNCMDMQIENGESLFEFLKKEMDDEEISFMNEGDISYICVKGKGYVYLKDDGFVSRMKKDVPTTLTFQIMKGNSLKLYSVTLKEDELTESGMKNYWNWVTMY